MAADADLCEQLCTVCSSQDLWTFLHIAPQSRVLNISPHSSRVISHLLALLCNGTYVDLVFLVSLPSFWSCTLHYSLIPVLLLNISPYPFCYAYLSAFILRCTHLSLIMPICLVVPICLHLSCYVLLFTHSCYAHLLFFSQSFYSYLVTQICTHFSYKSF